jgi:hypothetical protein
VNKYVVTRQGLCFLISNTIVANKVKSHNRLLNICIEIIVSHVEYASDGRISRLQLRAYWRAHQRGAVRSAHVAWRGHESFAGVCISEQSRIGGFLHEVHEYFSCCY